MPEVRIAEEDPRTPDVRALLGQHLAYAGEHTRPEDIFALDVDALLDAAVSFFAYRLDGELLGVAALKELGGGHAEVKSMHTAREARRRGLPAPWSCTSSG